MLERFEIYSVDSDHLTAAGNVDAEWQRVREAAVLGAIIKMDGAGVSPKTIKERSKVVQLDGSDLFHFVYCDRYLISWTQPRVELLSKCRVHLTVSIGRLPAPSEEVLRFYQEA